MKNIKQVIPLRRKYTKDFVCEECFEDHPPYAKGLCNPCNLRLHRKGYVDRDIARAGSGSVNVHGYLILSIGNKRISKHRLVMEEHLGRKLTDVEVVHHIDENKLNNSINNLQLFATVGEHTAHHRQMKR